MNHQRHMHIGACMPQMQGSSARVGGLLLTCQVFQVRGVTAARASPACRLCRAVTGCHCPWVALLSRPGLCVPGSVQKSLPEPGMTVSEDDVGEWWTRGIAPRNGSHVPWAARFLLVCCLVQRVPAGTRTSSLALVVDTSSASSSSGGRARVRAGDSFCSESLAS